MGCGAWAGHPHRFQDTLHEGHGQHIACTPMELPIHSRGYGIPTDHGGDATRASRILRATWYIFQWTYDEYVRLQRTNPWQFNMRMFFR